MSAAAKPLFQLQLRNELDVLQAQKRARECAQLAQLTAPAQTKFATAVSEISRNAIEHAGRGELTLNVVPRDAEHKGPWLEAIIRDHGRGLDPSLLRDPLPTRPGGRGYGLYTAQRLADDFDLKTSAEQGTRVVLRQRIPDRHPPLVEATLSAWRQQLTRDVDVSPYEELKRQNTHLVQVYEELQQKNQLAEQQIDVISRLNYELEKLNAANETLLAERAAKNLALERRNEELDAFAHTITHDLKSPLHNIDGLAQVIAQGVVANDLEDITYCTQLLQQQAAWMERLIHGILAYARAGREELPRIRVDVGALAADVARSVQLPPGFRVHISPELPTLLTEEIFLQQVLSNLIGNAGKYHHNPAQGQAWVTAEQRDGQLEFSVTDDGPGIRPEDRASLFQIFQVTASRATHDSTGVGLAIVRKLVRDKGGDIRAEPGANGCGTRFVFSWPAHEIVAPGT